MKKTAENDFDKAVECIVKSDFNKNLNKCLDIVKELDKKDKEIDRLNNIINELEQEIDRLLERQYESERFAKEQGFDTYLPAKENLLCVKNKLQELKGGNKE